MYSVIKKATRVLDRRHFVNGSLTREIDVMGQRWERHLCTVASRFSSSEDSDSNWYFATRSFSLLQADGKIDCSKDFLDRLEKDPRITLKDQCCFYAFYKDLRISVQILIQQIQMITRLSFVRVSRPQRWALNSGCSNRHCCRIVPKLLSCKEGLDHHPFFARF